MLGLLILPAAALAQLLPPTINTIAGGGSPAAGNGDGGQATAARVSEPVGVAVDGAGNVYVAERYSFTVRKINTTGVITTVAGNGTQSFNGDGISATSAGIDVRGIAVDNAGALYIADGSNHRVRKVSGDGTISTIARTGLNFPSRVAVDRSGVVHVIDGTRVFRIEAGGALQLVAGNGQYGTAGDGGSATLAQLENPTSLAFDAAGRLYIAGGERVRRVEVSGNISTYAGGGHFKIDPLATSYRWLFPYGVALDSRGNLYVASGNNLVRVVSPAGIADDAAGHLVLEFGFASGAPFGFSGDGGSAITALLHEPEAVAVDAHDNIYIADTRNNRVRKVTPVPTPRTPLGVSAFAPQAVYPVGSYGRGIAVADVTGDGRDDVLMVTSDWGRGYEEPGNDNMLNLFVQRTNGTLAQPLKYSHGDNAEIKAATGPVVGDLNRDGYADVVVGVIDGIRIFLGRSDGLAPGVQFAGLPHAQPTLALVVVDANADGHLDVVTLSGGRAEGGQYPDDLYGFIYFFGNGAGGISSKQFVPMDQARPWGGRLQVSDLNDDGRPDLVGNWSDMFQDGAGMWNYRHGVAWKPGQVGGGFGAVRYASIVGINGSHSYTIADFDGNGRKDVLMAAAANAPQAYYVLLSQDSSGEFVETRRWQAYDVPSVLLGTDMNGDGQADLLVLHAGWHALGLQVGVGLGLEMESKTYIDESSNPNSYALATGDLNGDGCRDVAIGDRNYGLVVLTGVACMIERNGAQPLLPPKPVQQGASSPASGTVQGPLAPVGSARNAAGGPWPLGALAGIGVLLLGLQLRWRLRR